MAATQLVTEGLTVSTGEVALSVSFGHGDPLANIDHVERLDQLVN